MSDPSFLPGLVPGQAVLFDERRRPDFRDAFGALARHATGIATAVTRVRLGTLDLTEAELEGIVRFRVLVAELNALSLDAEARALARIPRRSAALEELARRLESGGLEVRSAPLGGWSPDFTVFFEDDRPFAVLTGYHSFERPYPHRGPALGAWHGRDGAALAARRHADLWGSAHDVGPAVWGLLSRARAGARTAGADRGRTAAPAERPGRVRAG